MVAEARAHVPAGPARAGLWPGAAARPALRAAARQAGPAALLALPLAAGAAWVGPLRDIPVLDDWAYAWSVEQLVRWGRWEVSGWSSHYPATQILWGSVFAWPAGFSFGALRLSTLVLAWVGALALYGAGREAGVGRGPALLAALTLLVNPVYFFLGHTFMTDIPYLAISLVALYGWLRGLRRRSRGCLWAGGGAALAAGLVRQPGLLLPLALLPAAWRGRHGWRRLAPAALASALALGALAVVAPRLPAFQARLAALGDFWGVPARVHVEGLWQVGLAVGLAGLPLVLACARATPRRTLLGAAAAVFVAALAHWAVAGPAPPSPFPPAALWGWDELGRSREHLPGLWEPQGPPDWLGIPLAALAALSLAFLLAGAASALRRWRDPRVRVVACAGGLHLALAIALWLYNDRYALGLVPPLLVLALMAWRGRPVRWARAAPALGAFFLVSALGTADALAAGEAAARAARDLAARGVSLGDIDAGYALSGWNQFAHPEWAGRAWRGWEEVPWVLSQRPLPYVIATTPLPGGYRTLEVRSWRGWGRHHPLYILHRPPPPQGGARNREP